MTQELRAFNGIKMWEIQKRLREWPVLQPVHGWSPHTEDGAWRQGWGTAEAGTSPGPQDMVGQLSDHGWTWALGDSKEELLRAVP